MVPIKLLLNLWLVPDVKVKLQVYMAQKEKLPEANQLIIMGRTVFLEATSHHVDCIILLLCVFYPITKHAYFIKHGILWVEISPW